MQVSVETTGSLGRLINITLPAELIDNEVENRLKNVANKAIIKGFRPGKAPLKTIRKTYEGSLRFEVIDDQMRKSLGEALQKENLAPAGLPQVSLVQAKAGEPLIFTASFEVFPEFKLKTLDGVTIEKILPVIQDADLHNTVEAIRKQHIRFVTTDRAAQNGDRVIIDFAGTLDGQPLPNGTGQSVPLNLGEHQFIAGFEEGLIGAKAGEERTLNIAFPENYHQKELSGKPVEFAVTVKEVLEPLLPELDETFLSALNIAGGNVETFFSEIRANMEREVNQAVKNKLKQTVFDKLVAANTFDIPQALIESEIDTLVKDATKEMQARYKVKSLPAIPRDLFKDRATYRIKLGLILRQAHQQFNLSLDTTRLQNMVEQFAAVYVNPQGALQWIQNNEERMREIEALCLEDQLIDKFLETATLLEKSETYPHLMQHDHHDHEHHEHGPDCNHDHDEEDHK